MAKGVDGQLHVLADRSRRRSPDGWARRAVVLLDELDGTGSSAKWTKAGISSS